MSKPYTGIEGNKIIGDLVQDINDILIELKESGWFTDVNYVPKRWEGTTHKIKSDSISIVIKKKENRTGSKYPEGSIFNIQDIREYTERIGDMFSDSDIKIRKCNPEGDWRNYMFGKWGDISSNYYGQVINGHDDILGIEINIYLKGENIDKDESKYNMKHIKGYNEGVWDIFKKKDIKETTKEPIVDKREMFLEGTKSELYVSDIDYSDNKFFSKKIPDIKLYNQYKKIEEPGLSQSENSKGLFVKTKERFYPYKFRTFVAQDELWFDDNHTFDLLREKSNKLGYRLNKDVHNLITDESSKIVDIVNFCFYEVYGTVENIKNIYTLLYKIEGDENYYPITQIELIENLKNNEVDAIIEENFYDLMDDNTVTYLSRKTGSGISCQIIINRLSPDSLFRSSEQLMIASKRLYDKDIILTIKSMLTNVISFTCTNKKRL